MRPGAVHRAVAAAVPLAAVVSPAAAHGFGQRYDLPLPLSHYVWGAGATVAVSFVVAAVFLKADRAGADLPGWRLRLDGGPARAIITALVRVIAALVLVLVIAAGFLGDQNPFRNLAPTMVWIIGWVGVSFLCAIVGDVWRLLNPWDTMYRAAEWLWSCGGSHEVRTRAYPQWLGVWPAFILFVGFAWMELVWSGRSVPAALAGALVGYSVITWTGMALFGRAVWLAHGEVFALVFGIFARFAPVVWPRRHEHVLALRLPASGLVEDQPLSPSMVALTIALLATVTFDGLLETPLWGRVDAAVLDARDDSFLWTTLALREDQALRLVRTVALPAIVLLFIAAYLAVCWCMARLAGKDSTMQVAGRFVLTLVPISLAYHVAHYVSYLFVGGQYAIPLASDPFGWGWNLFGTAAYRVDIGLVGPRLQWDVALVSVVTGHIIAVCLAHVVALRMFADRRAALLTQVPMLVLMVAYTMCSLWILSQPIVESPG